MATQYTAGLTTGQVLTAATMNSIGAAWETWTPTITASSGTFTTITVNMARYGRIQNLVYVNLDFTITSVGTATGVVLITLPIAAKAPPIGLSCGTFREVAVSGYSGIISVDSGTAGSLRKYDNSSYIAANLRFTCSFQYEAA